MEGLTEAERAADYRLGLPGPRAGRGERSPWRPSSSTPTRCSVPATTTGGTDVPLGLAVDLGSTTVAVFVTTWMRDKLCRGGRPQPADCLWRRRHLAHGRCPAEAQGRLSAFRCWPSPPSSRPFDALKLSRRIKEPHRKSDHRWQLRHAPPAAASAGGHLGQDALPAAQYARSAFGGRSAQFCGDTFPAEAGSRCLRSSAGLSALTRWPVWSTMVLTAPPGPWPPSTWAPMAR